MYGHYFIDPEQMDRGQVREIDYDLTPDFGEWFNIDGNFEEDKNLVPDMGFMAVYLVLIALVSRLYIFADNHFMGKSEKDYGSKFYITFTFICGIIPLGMLVVHSFGQGEMETCYFNRWCHEAADGGIIPSNIYYQLYEECPDPWALTVMYHDENHNDHCENTEYGCCEIWNAERCSTAMENNFTYSVYQYILETNVSHWSLNVEKVDEGGTNCPTIEDIIYDVSLEHDYHFKFNYLEQCVFYCICITDLLIVRLCCFKRVPNKPYIQTDYGPLDSEKDVLQGSV